MTDNPPWRAQPEPPAWAVWLARALLILLVSVVGAGGGLLLQRLLGG